MIPRQVFQSWISPDSLPEREAKWIESWDKLNCKIIPLRLTNALYLGMPMRNPAERVMAGDTLKLEHILRWGGVQIDNDVAILQDFDDLLEYDFFIGAESPVWLNTAILGAVPGSPIVRELLDEMQKPTDHRPKPTIPLLCISNILRRYGWDNRSNQDWVDPTGKIKVCRSSIFYPFHWSKEFDPSCVQPETKAIHWWSKSWLQ